MQMLTNSACNEQECTFDKAVISLADGKEYGSVVEDPFTSRESTLSCVKGSLEAAGAQ